jgi:hypothetical protein
MKIMNEVTYLDGHDEDTNSLTLDDPALFKCPVAYIIEVGWWTLTTRPPMQAAPVRRQSDRLRADDRSFGDRAVDRHHYTTPIL